MPELRKSRSRERIWSDGSGTASSLGHVSRIGACCEVKVLGVSSGYSRVRVSVPSIVGGSTWYGIWGSVAVRSLIWV